MKHLKTYESVARINAIELDLEVGDIWKADLNDSSRWWIVAELDFVIPKFWLNMNNKIKCLHINLDEINKIDFLKNVGNWIFNYTTSFSPESNMQFTNTTYDIRDLWNDNREALIKITKALQKSKNSHIVDVWFKKLPELEIEIETEKYNL